MLLYEQLFCVLDASGTRYVVVGGVATVLHGYARLTADIDLIIDLEEEATARAMCALGGLGLQPRAPVRAADFADARIRSPAGSGRHREAGEDCSTREAITMSRAQTDDSASSDTRQWNVTWEDVERAQLETMLSATPAQRFAWLEEAMRLALVSGALEARRESSAVPGGLASSDLPRKGSAAYRSSGGDE